MKRVIVRRRRSPAPLDQMLKSTRRVRQRKSDTVPNAVVKRLGIRVEPGRSSWWYEIKRGKKIDHPPQDGWWLHYGHSRGAEWFKSERKALDALETYVDKRLSQMAKEFTAFNTLHRWVVGRLNFQTLDGEEG